MQKALFSATLIALAAIAPAQVTYETVVSQSAIRTFTGASGDAQINGIAVSADESTIYFTDSVSNFDGVAVFDGSTIATYLTEAQIGTPFSSTSISHDDLTIDANGNVYEIIRTGGSTKQIVRYPSAGTSEAVVLTADAAEAVALAVDDVNGLLYIAFDEFSGTAIDKVASVPLTATNATPTIVADEPALAAAVTTTDQILELSGIAVLPNGDIIVANGGYGASANRGDIIKIVPGSPATVSTFVPAANVQALVAEQGADPANGVGRLAVASTADGRTLVFHAERGSVAGRQPNFLASIPAGGGSITTLLTQSDMLTGLGFDTAEYIGLGGQSSFQVIGDDTIYIGSEEGVSGSEVVEGIFKISGFSPEPETNAASWNLYN